MFIRSELAYVVPFPVPCSGCGNENFEFAARLVDLEEITCPSCGAVLDLNTKDWVSFRKSLKKLCVGKLAPVAPVKTSS
jgi:hypothetical protein